jgi:copper chaperone CopZ
MNTKTYQIPAINCVHCVHTIKNELSELEGVQYVDGNLEEKLITVTYDDPANPEKIEKLLDEIGYPVTK